MTRFSSILLLLGASAMLTGAIGCKRRNPMPTLGEENALPMPAAPIPAPLPAGNPPLPDPNMPANVNENPPQTGEPKPNADIAVLLKADKALVKAGESITFTITARNTSAKTQQITFNSGQSFDVVVRPLAANEDKPQDIWRWSTGRMFTMALRTVSLGAGQERSWTTTWDYTEETAKSTPRGIYEAQAELAIIRPRFSSPIRLELVP